MSLGFRSTKGMSGSRGTEVPSPLETSAFTLRAFLLGCVFAFFVSAGSAYGTLYLQGSFMALGTSTVGAVFLLALLTGLVNPLLRLVHPRAGLNQQELLVIYIMMVMASPIPTLFCARFLSQITAPFYYATPENDWRNLIQPYIPHWLMPHDAEILSPFYEGGEQGQSIPWEAWVPTFLAWTPFVWALFLVMIASMVVLRKQWVENERLVYPLVQVPLAMTEQGGERERIPPFFKNPVMWAGFAVPFLWGTLHGLYNYFPDVFLIAEEIDMVRLIVPIFRDTSELHIKLRPNILGFFYFLKTEVAFSLWFFNLLFNIVRGIFGVLGITSSETLGGGHAVRDPILAHQSMGAMLVLFLGGLWTARKHLKEVFRKAFTGDSTVDDSGEILSYRTAVIVLITGNLVLVGWLWLAGMPLWVALSLICLAAVIIYGYTRVVAEGGLSDGSPPVVPAGILVSAVGSSVIGSQGLVILATTYFWTAGVRSFVMTSCANGLRLGEELGSGKRPLFWALVLGVVIALAGSIWVIMILSQEYGALNLRIWSERNAYDYMGNMIHSPKAPHLWGWINTGIGAVIMSGLMIARWRYVWWPLHPLGYPIGPIWIMTALWFNMFLAWLIKVLVLKYGGVGLYMKTRPFFFGMILGHISPGGFYLIIDHFTGMTGNVIFWG